MNKPTRRTSSTGNAIPPIAASLVLGTEYAIGSRMAGGLETIEKEDSWYEQGRPMFTRSRKHKFLDKLEEIASMRCYTPNGTIDKEHTNEMRMQIIRYLKKPELFRDYVKTVGIDSDGLVIPLYTSPQGRPIQYKK